MRYFWPAFAILTMPMLSAFWFFTVSLFSPKFTLDHFDYEGNWVFVLLLVYYAVLTPALSRLLVVVFN